MSNHDDLTDDLTQALSEHAHTMDGSTLHLADVQGRARSIRRRRTAVAVGGVAAALALIVPTAALATHSNGKVEPAPVTQTPNPSEPTQSPGHQPAPGVLDVSDLATGSAPRLEYVTGGRVLHQIDGSTVDIPTTYPVSSFVSLTDGTHVWLTRNDGTPYIEVQDGNGTLHAPVRSGEELAVNQAHTAAAWVDPGGQVFEWAVGATQAHALGNPIRANHDVRVAAILGDDCSIPCTVFVNAPTGTDGQWQPWEVNDDDTRVYTDGGLLMVNGIGGSLTIGYDKLTEFGSCSVLSGGGEFQGFRTCKNSLESFSPDDSLILGKEAYGDGIGSGDIAMYDLKGNRLFDRHSTEDAQSFYSAAGWEDSTHVLAPVFQDGQWSVVRFTSDGSMEYAVPPIAGQDVDNPYVVATGGPTLGD